MKFELTPYNKLVSEKEVIDDFKKVAQGLGKNSVTQREYVRQGKYSVKTIYAKFGSWKAVLEASDLNLSTNIGTTISNEDLFTNLENVWMKLGRQPTYNEMIKPLSKYHACTYERRFKGWRKSLESFVEFVNREEHISSEEAIKNIAIEPTTKHKTSRTINWRLRFIILRRDNFKCKNCGRSPATDPKVILHVDHIKAWAKGGETTQENLQTLCSVCNLGKSDLDNEVNQRPGLSKK